MRFNENIESEKQISPAPVSIGFRLQDSFSRRELARRAAILERSPHELARFYVMSALRDKEDAAALRMELRRFHADFLFSLEAILTKAHLSQKEAEDWIAKNFEGV
jgi:hypothetical protein